MYPNNISDLKQQLENLYLEFQDENRNLRMFIIIHKYTKALDNPILKKKIREITIKLEKTFQAYEKNNLSKIQETKSPQEILDDISDAFDDNSFFYFILTGLSLILDKAIKNKEPNLREKADDSVGKKYKKFLEFMLESVHEDIICYLDEKELMEEEKERKTYLDNEKSILYIKGQKVKIKGKADFPVVHYILEYLFEQEDKNEEAYYKDIAEKKFNNYEYNGEKGYKRYYNACKNANEKIRKKIGIDDFLIPTTGKTGNVKMNKKYL